MAADTRVTRASELVLRSNASQLVSQLTMVCNRVVGLYDTVERWGLQHRLCICVLCITFYREHRAVSPNKHRAHTAKADRSGSFLERKKLVRVISLIYTQNQCTKVLQFTDGRFRVRLPYYGVHKRKRFEIRVRKREIVWESFSKESAHSS